MEKRYYTELVSYRALRDIWVTYMNIDPKKTLPVDPRQFLGSIEPTILDKYFGTYFAVKDSTKKGIIVASCAGNSTSDTLYRVRCLYLYEKLNDEDRNACLDMIIDACCTQARNEGSYHLWDLCGLTSPWLEKGFEIKDSYKDGLYFISRTIEN